MPPKNTGMARVLANTSSSNCKGRYIGNSDTSCPAPSNPLASALSRMHAPQYQPPVPGVRKAIFSGRFMVPHLP